VIEKRAHHSRERDRSARSIDGNKCRPRTDKSVAVGRSGDQIVERDSARPYFGKRRANANQLIVPGRPVKSRGHLGDRESNTSALHVGVAHPARANEVGSTDLTPDHVVRMIDDAHLVGLGVPNAELDVVVHRLERRREGFVRHSAKFVGAHSFVKREGRR